MHRSFRLNENIPHMIGPSTIVNFSPPLAMCCPALRCKDTSSRQICLEELSILSLSDDVGSTGPYDDDGYQAGSDI